MEETFAAEVTAPQWRREADDWITEQLARVGRRLSGDIEQPRVRPWSTQLVVPTDRGTVWFKANCESMAFEPRVHALLARLEPDEVDEPLALREERGWMMTADRGVTLGDSHEPTLSDWQAVVALAATLQRRLVEHGAQLVRAGLPDGSPPTVLGRFDDMGARLAALPPSHPSHLSPEAHEELRAGRTVVAQAVETLKDGPLPATLQHGDLHPKNVFAVDGGMRVFDFGDAQWAHALEILAVPYGWVTRLTELPWPQVLDAYAAVWEDVVGREELERLMVPAMVTHAVNRSWTWWGACARATPEELVEWGDAPLYYLQLALEPFPPPEGSGP